MFLLQRLFLFKKWAELFGMLSCPWTLGRNGRTVHGCEFTTEAVKANRCSINRLVLFF
jgi:hypothetical protein